MSTSISYYVYIAIVKIKSKYMYSDLLLATGLLRTYRDIYSSLGPLTLAKSNIICTFPSPFILFPHPSTPLLLPSPNSHPPQRYNIQIASFRHGAFGVMCLLQLHIDPPYRYTVPEKRTYSACTYAAYGSVAMHSAIDGPMSRVGIRGTLRNGNSKGDINPGMHLMPPMLCATCIATQVS